MFVDMQTVIIVALIAYILGIFTSLRMLARTRG
jgi:hypothetical protein